MSTQPTHRELAATAERIFRAGLSAVDPEAAVRRALSLDGEVLWLHDPVHQNGPADPAGIDLSAYRRVLVVGGGKAGAPMVRALEELLGDRIDAGLVVVKEGHGRPPGEGSGRVSIREAAHPVPDAAGVSATEELLALAAEADAETLAMCVLSGGGSALLTAPAGDISLADLRAVTSGLLGAGVDIQGINTVRKHLSQIKGGHLARALAPARIVTLVLSDVIGDPLDAIASGPTVPDPTTFADARRVLQGAGLWGDKRLPPAVAQHIEAGVAGELHETPSPGDPGFRGAHQLLVANNRAALAACEAEARALGYEPLVLSSTAEGEAKELGCFLASIAREVRERGRPAAPPLCVISGGEPTVTFADLEGAGKGGRNQEMALAAATSLQGLSGVALLCAGTDGTDGPTDAAGAFAFGDTVRRAEAAGRSCAAALAGHDAYPLFAALGDLLITGPTGTNVMDLHLLLVAAQGTPS